MLLHSYSLFASTTGGMAGISPLVSSSQILRSVIQPMLVFFDAPQSILGVPPPSEDYFHIESDLTASAVEVNFATCIAKDCNEEEVVDKSRKMVSHACVRW